MNGFKRLGISTAGFFSRIDLLIAGTHAVEAVDSLRWLLTRRWRGRVYLNGNSHWCLNLCISLRSARV